MRTSPVFILVFVFLGWLSGAAWNPLPAGARVADRIMAVVNKAVIALSDVQKYRALFMKGADAGEAAALDELINQKLLLGESKKLEIPPPSVEEVADAFRKLKETFGGPEAFEEATARFSFTEGEVEQLVRNRLQVDRLIEQRIRFFVFVNPEEIETAYDEERRRFPDRTPEEVRKDVSERLISEKSKDKLSSYLARLREKADIRINRPPPEALREDIAR